MTLTLLDGPEVEWPLDLTDEEIEARIEEFLTQVYRTGEVHGD